MSSRERAIDKYEMQKWRNWQTRRLQVPVVAIPCGFKSRLPHSFLFVTIQSQADFLSKVWVMLAWMNTFTWKSIWRIRHTDEMRSILEVVLNRYFYLYIFSLHPLLSYHSLPSATLCPLFVTDIYKQPDRVLNKNKKRFKTFHFYSPWNVLNLLFRFYKSL